MDEIYQSAKAFENMFNIVYNMKISYKKTMLSFQLDFRKNDFFHLVGLQYITDKDLGRNPEIAFDNIIKGDITDTLLGSSIFYREVPNNYVIVEERIRDFKHIEECLDCKSILFKYIKGKNEFSNIKADFMFEVSLNHEADGIINVENYYIFFSKRKKEENYRLVSFFRKMSSYNGDSAYWLFKEKVNNLNHTSDILYQSKGLIEEVTK